MAWLVATDGSAEPRDSEVRADLAANLHTVADPKTPGDLFFESYCALNGYDAQHVVRWRARFGVDTPKNRDYLVDRVGDRAIVEVKHFTTTRLTERVMSSPRQTASFGGRDLYGNLQKAIRDASGQLAPFASVGVALVVLMTNPTGSDINFHCDDVVSALFGEVKLRVDAEPGGRVEAVFSENGEVLAREPDGRLTNRHPHLSAVVALYGLPGFPRVDVYDLSGAPGFTGTPLPHTMFDGNDDSWLGFTGELRFARLGHRV